MTKIMSGSNRSLRSADAARYPILDAYFEAIAEEIAPMLRYQVGMYIDDEDDSFAVTPPEILAFLQGRADPLKSEDFLTKRQIRRKRANELIHKF